MKNNNDRKRRILLFILLVILPFCYAIVHFTYICPLTSN